MCNHLVLQVPCIQVKQDYPTYVVCAWLGNTPAVAPKYDLTVTDEHSETASKKLGISWRRRRPQGLAPTRTKKPHRYESAGKREFLGCCGHS